MFRHVIESCPHIFSVREWTMDAAKGSILLMSMMHPAETLKYLAVAASLFPVGFLFYMALS